MPGKFTAVVCPDVVIGIGDTCSNFKGDTDSDERFLCAYANENLVPVCIAVITYVSTSSTNRTAMSTLHLDFSCTRGLVLRLL